MPNEISLKVLGCGDAFGSGGQLNTCFFVRSPASSFLIDCGATSLPAMKEHGLSSEDVDEIVITHFHGDHYGGIPFFLLDALILQQRKKPLTIFGPTGIEKRIKELMEALYPGTSEKLNQLKINFLTYRDGATLEEDGISVMAKPVLHTEASLPHAVRIMVKDKVISFSGDTRWSENLVPIADGADLFICECNAYDQKIPAHLDYMTLKEKVPQLKAKRVILNHLGEQMLAKKEELELEIMEKGMEIKL